MIDSRIYIQQLRRAVERLDDSRAVSLCNDLVRDLPDWPTPFPEDDASTILDLLRRGRYMDQVLDLAERFQRNGQRCARVRRHVAQALIEKGYLFAALAVCDDILRDDAADAKEKMEAKGLCGRIYKQVYLDTAAARHTMMRDDALVRSVIAYRDVYRQRREQGLEDDETLWHGINLVALVIRAERDGRPLRWQGEAIDNEVDPEAEARWILEVAEARYTDSVSASPSEPDVWAAATAAEACIALGEFLAALKWVGLYTSHPAFGAFHLASTLRQFTDLWLLSDDDPQHHLILNRLQNALKAR